MFFSEAGVLRMAFSKASTRSSNVLLGLGSGRRTAKKSPMSFRCEGVSRSTCSSSARTRSSADRLRSERSDIGSQSRVSPFHNQADDSMEQALLSLNFRWDSHPEFRPHLTPGLNLVRELENRSYFQNPILFPADW